MRRTISETPRFLLSKLNKESPIVVSRVVSELTGYQEEKISEPEEFASFKPQKLLSAKWMKCLIGTAGAWFLLDVAFYGNGVSSMLIMNTISPHSNLLVHTLLSAVIFLFFAVPGYIFAAIYVDRIGRRVLQILGFAVMGICYVGIIFIPNVQNIQSVFWLLVFLLVFGMSFFFVNFGPNTTTFLIPSEIYPTNIRARAHGLSAAIGKVGAFFGAFFLPLMLKSHGLAFTMGFVAIISFSGILTTFLVPEMKGKSLDSSEIMS